MMKVKNILKKLLAVTLVLCISMLGAAAAFAEKTERTPVLLYWSNEPSTPVILDRLAGGLGLTVTDDPSSLDANGAYEYWVLIYGAVFQDVMELPDLDSIAAVFFVDSITTPSADTLDEVLNPWIEYLTGLVKNGVPVYLFNSYIQGATNYYSSSINNRTLQKIEELANTPDSGITKLEGFENPESLAQKGMTEVIYLIQIDEENAGPFYTIASETSTYAGLHNAVDFLADLIASQEAGK